MFSNIKSRLVLKIYDSDFSYFKVKSPYKSPEIGGKSQINRH